MVCDGKVGYFDSRYHIALPTESTEEESIVLEEAKTEGSSEYNNPRAARQIEAGAGFHYTFALREGLCVPRCV
jgi:hypothetical protein